MFDVKDTDFFDLEDESFDNIVESDITFTGNIKLKKTFMIRGKLNGTITSESDLVVDTKAVVNANITAERVLIRGKVRGNVSGSKLIFVTASASFLRFAGLNARIVPSRTASAGMMLYVVPEWKLPTPIKPPSTGETSRLTTVWSCVTISAPIKTESAPFCGLVM